MTHDVHRMARSFCLSISLLTSIEYQRKVRHRCISIRYHSAVRKKKLFLVLEDTAQVSIMIQHRFTNLQSLLVSSYFYFFLILLFSIVLRLLSFLHKVRIGKNIGDWSMFPLYNSQPTINAQKCFNIFKSTFRSVVSIGTTILNFLMMDKISSTKKGSNTQIKITSTFHSFIVKTNPCQKSKRIKVVNSPRRGIEPRSLA